MPAASTAGRATRCWKARTPPRRTAISPGNTNPTNAADSSSGTTNTIASAARPCRPRICRATLSIIGFRLPCGWHAVTTVARSTYSAEVGAEGAGGEGGAGASGSRRPQAAGPCRVAGLCCAADPGAGSRRDRRRGGLHDGNDRAQPALRAGPGRPPPRRPGLHLHRGGRRGGGDRPADAAATGSRRRPGRRAEPLSRCAGRGGRAGLGRAGRPDRRGRPPMRAAALVAVAVSLVFAASGPLVGRRLPPAAATRLLTAGRVLVAGSSGVVAGVLAFTWVGQLPVLAAAGQWSVADLRSADPIPTALAACCAVVLLPAAGWWLRAAARRGRDLIRLYRTCRHVHAAGALVVIDDARP